MVIPLNVRASAEPRTAMERRAVMTWAQRLKRVFNIDIETCKKAYLGSNRSATGKPGTAGQAV